MGTTPCFIAVVSSGHVPPLRISGLTTPEVGEVWFDADLFYGAWLTSVSNPVSISGDHATFEDCEGPESEVPISYKGKTCELLGCKGTLGTDGQIYWSDGDIWSKDLEYYSNISMAPESRNEHSISHEPNPTSHMTTSPSTSEPNHLHGLSFSNNSLNFDVPLDVEHDCAERSCSSSSMNHSNFEYSCMSSNRESSQPARPARTSLPPGAGEVAPATEPDVSSYFKFNSAADFDMPDQAKH